MISAFSKITILFLLLLSFLVAVIVICTALLTFSGHFTPLDSAEALAANAGRADVAVQKVTAPAQDAVTPKQRTRRGLNISDEMWMNPEMTAEKMAGLLGTNQHYLSEAIKEAGYLTVSIW